MNLRLGDVVLVRMPFHEGSGVKIRPAVVTLDSGDDDFIAVPITSRSRPSEFDLELHDWREASLKVPSTARIHKLTVLPKRDLFRSLGRLSASDLEAFAHRLCRTYCATAAQPVPAASPSTK
jgi:mRNA interferase MazF